LSWCQPRHYRGHGSASWLLLAALLLGGCHINEPSNASFDITAPQARDALAQMAKTPKRFDRPVVGLSGWLDPGLAESALKSRLKSVTTDEQVIIGVSFFGGDDFDACRKRVLDRVKEKLDAAEGPPVVDVVAFSMGGLVARHVARAPDADADSDGGRAKPPLRIERLFTISTPHRGASLARLPTFGRLTQQMAPGSAFLKQLNAELSNADYRLIPYVRLGDGIVGSVNAAPPDRWPWWLPTPLFANAHLAYDDPRIVADIARRLRNETPFTQAPPAPLPKAFREP
jgi:pimeloyl-ACP methyl ester carboxylesterase